MHYSIAMYGVEGKEQLLEGGYILLTDRLPRALSTRGGANKRLLTFVGHSVREEGQAIDY